MRRGLLALALACLPFAAPAQEADRDWLTAFLEDNLSAAGRQVVITGFEGALSSEATIRQLTIADDRGIWLTINGVVLDWNRSALLGGRVEVTALTAEEIIVARMPDTTADPALPAPEAQPFAVPELPVSVDIADLGAARIVLGAPLLGQEVTGRLSSSLSLSGAGQGQGRFVLERTDGTTGRIGLNASFANATRELTLELTAQEAAGGLAARALGLPGTPSVDLAVTGAGPLSDFRADLALQTDGQERLRGNVVLTGAGAGATAFSASLNGNLAPLFVPAYADFLGDSLALQVNGTRGADGSLDLPVVDLKARTVSLAGSVSLGPDAAPRRVAIMGAIEDPAGQPVLLPFGSDPTRIGRAGVALLFDAAVSQDWAGKLTIDRLDRPDIRIARLELGGKSRVAAGATGATLTYAATGIAATDPGLARALGDALSGVVVADWDGTTNTLSLPTVTGTGAGLVLNGSATVGNLAEGIEVTARARLTADDLARFGALAGAELGGSGQIDLRRLVTNLATGAFDIDATVAGQGLRIGVAEVDNLLAGASTVTLQAVRDETGIRLTAFDLAAATLRATGSGTVASAGSDIAARVDFTDLSVLGAGYGGRLQADARLTGTPQAGTVSLTGTGTDLAIGLAEADSLLRGTSAITLDATLADGGVDLRSLRLTAQNLVADATGRLAPEGSTVAANLRLPDLAVLGGGYGGGLTARASLAGTPEAGRITINGTGTGLRIGDPQADRLLADTSTLSAALRTEGGVIRLDRGEIRNPQLQATASGTVQGGDTSVTLDARLNDLALLVPEFPGAVTLRGTAVQSAQGTTLDLTGRGPGGIDAAVRGTLGPGFARADLAITGRAQAALANVFIDPTNILGAATFDLRLNGPLSPASLAGRVAVSDGRITGPSLPFTLTGVSASADIAGGRATLAARGEVSSGGAIAVQGGVGMAAPFPADLTVDLQRVVLRDPQLYETRGNGTITLSGPLTGGAQIAGRIVLIESEIRIPDTGFGDTGSLPGLEHVDEPAAVRQTRRYAGLLGDGATAGGTGGGAAYALNIEISHPNRLFVRGRGLDTELGGSLTLRGTTAAIVPDGAFRLIRGRLDILGTRLTVSEADLRLEGDFVPTVRILASSTSDGIVSSVRIQGRIDDPQVDFTSNPELPQEEVLSRLLFGRGIDTLSAFQAAQLAGAVATLAGRGGEGILSRLRRGFGLDDLDVATGVDGTTSVTAGKYLSRNLYTQVEVDQDGKSDISLNLDLTESLTVRGRVGSEGDSGLGVFFERDY